MGRDIADVVLGFFPLWALLLALAIAAIRSAGGARPRAAVFADELLFWAIGVAGIWGAVFHLFFADTAARAIGWAPGGFETEVGFADLALGVLGMSARFASRPYRQATVVAAACFLWGAAANHIAGIVRAGNVNPGNAGPVLWADVVIPAAALWAVLASPRPRILD